MENDISSEKTINDKWLENIFESLMRLEGFERLMRNGCQNLLEYIQNGNINLADVQYKNYQLFITETEILIQDTRHLIDKNKFLQISLLLGLIKNYEREVEGFLKTNYNDLTHSQTNELKLEFLNIFSKVSKLRGLFVSSLWKLLSPSAKENIGGLPQ